METSYEQITFFQ